MSLNLVVGGSGCLAGHALDHVKCCGLLRSRGHPRKCWTDPSALHLARTAAEEDIRAHCCGLRVQRHGTRTTRRREWHWGTGEANLGHQRNVADWLQLTFLALIGGRCGRRCSSHIASALDDLFDMHFAREHVERQMLYENSSTLHAVAEVRSLHVVLALLCWEALQIRELIVKVPGPVDHAAIIVRAAFKHVWEPLLLVPWLAVISLSWPIFNIVANLYDLWHERPDTSSIGGAEFSPPAAGQESLRRATMCDDPEAKGCQENPEIQFLRAGIWLHQAWQMREESQITSPRCMRDFSDMLHSSQIHLLRHAEAGTTAISHPITLDLRVQPQGSDAQTGAWMANRGWRGGGWPVLRVLHGIFWQEAGERIDIFSLLWRNAQKFNVPWLPRSERVLSSEPRGPVMLDAGAHIGSEALEFSHHWPSGTVYALEPNAAAFGKLQRNVVAADVSNIVMLPDALSHMTSQNASLYVADQKLSALPDNHATATLLPPRRGHALWGLHMERRPSQKVQTHTLDSLAAYVGIRKFDFLHLDLQGSEFPVLRAASSDLLEQVIAMQVEVVEAASKFWLGAQSGEPLLRLLERRGFVRVYTTPRMLDNAFFDAVVVNRNVLPSALSAE